jgi:elongation factor P hydroxylase
MAHVVDDLIRIFNQCFEKDYETRLEKGENEPWYLPKTSDYPFHRILFAHGFFSSALHELAHWFIAGSGRRMLIDYGYWYEPDGRSEDQQRLFERVEVKPQAIEWILSKSCDYRFQFSLDNLNGDVGDTSKFREAVAAQATLYTFQGLPARAEHFRKALCDFYGTHPNLRMLTFP